MKKLLGIALLVMSGHVVLAQVDSAKSSYKNGSYYSHQNDTTKNKKEKPTYASLNLKNRPNDHFMIEFSYDNWIGKTDSMNTSGFSRGFAMYFMYDFPFKSDPHFSVGAGIGINASNIFFDKTEVLVAATGNQTLAFPSTANTNHFKKYKLVLTNLEIPLELRYAFNPANTNKSWKIALGFKGGFLMSAYTKGKGSRKPGRSGNRLLYRKEKFHTILQWRPYRRHRQGELWIYRRFRAITTHPIN